MERQSSKIYFNGKYHKDIYFQGHYHKAAYLTDREGNATLVWEKLTDKNIETVSISVDRLGYLNGLYIALSKTTYDLYYGEDLGKMHCFKSQGWGTTGILVTNDNEIVIERITDKYYYYALFTIPILNGNLNFKGLVWNRCKGAYFFNRDAPLVVGNKNNYYEKTVHSFKPIGNDKNPIYPKVQLLHDNNRIVSYDSLVNKAVTYGILHAAGKVILQGNRVTSINGYTDDSMITDKDFNVPIRFFELNDAETELELKEIYLTDEIIEKCEADLKRKISELYDKNTYHIGKYDYFSAPCFRNFPYGGVDMEDDDKGMLWIQLRTRAHLIVTSTGAVASPSYVSAIMYIRISVNFNNYEIIGYEINPAVRQDLSEAPKTINGPQFFTKNWTVYRCNLNNNSRRMRDNFLFYRKRRSYSGNFLPMSNVFADITSGDLDYEATINSVAEIGEYLYVGVERGSRNGWIRKIIRVNTSDNTWEDITIEITGIIKEA